MQPKWDTYPKKNTHKLKLSNIFLFLIPLLLSFYILLLNFNPLGNSKEYLLNIGDSKDSSGKIKLTGPFDRVTTQYTNNSTGANYRDALSGLVYFDLSSSLLTDSSSINLEIAFEDNFPENQQLNIGPRSKKEWSYYWKPVYNSFYQSLEPLSNIITLKATNLTDLEKTLQQIPEGSSIASYKTINNTFSSISYEPGSTKITKTIRGVHTLYTYAKDTLNMVISKQDMNWYNGTDELKIRITGSNITREFIIPDDGNNMTGNKGPIQSQSFFVENLPKGVYRIDMENNADLTINSIQVNQKRLVAVDNVFLIDPSTIYFEVPRKQTIYFHTIHKSSIQTLSITGITSKSIEIKESVTKYNITLPAGSYILTSPKGDIIIEGPTYFSFDKESYFRPFKYEIIPLKYNLDWVKNNADYVIIPDLNVTDLGGGWKIGRASWDAKDLYIKDKTLSFSINIPHLSQEQYKNYTIPIDWVKVTVTKPSIFEEIFGGLK